MRVIPALAAIGAMVRGLFARKPKKVTVETPLTGQPSKPRSTKKELRKARRKHIMRSYTRTRLRVVMRAPYEQDASLDDAGNAAAKREYHRAWRNARRAA